MTNGETLSCTGLNICMQLIELTSKYINGRLHCRSQLQCQRTQFVETVIAGDEQPAPVQFYTESPITDSSAGSNSREWTLD